MIQTDLLASPTVPGGAPFISDGFSQTRGNISMGGMNTPVADAQQSAVTVLPFSALLSCPTQCFSLAAVILPGTWQTVKPLSSTLKILPGGMSCRPDSSKSRAFSIENKLSTFGLLKPIACCIETDSAWRTDNSL